MLSPLQEKAIELYKSGKNLREVAAEVQRSHEWVRKLLKKMDEELRHRGRAPVEHPECAYCKQPCAKSDSVYCGKACMYIHRYKVAAAKLQPAIRVLRMGGSYAEAAEAAGFQSAWHLWGRLNHFQFTEQFRARKPRRPKDDSTEPTVE